ncbi:hypothetical protein [Candidatus Protochlamydia amoebophila]|uniref:Uncharacterized protein n=1 Tax=Candidatus Protochlamydia amoebophila TaxID=362787 RepID=A0A0C1H268_9BACT|nr:hypothetical protein [Candidatus Protochlamydia amoebophila]KIC71779.1 hypothetical protein DB44_DA00330 [Candidatus Protochlamydia amoebophila]
MIVSNWQPPSRNTSSISDNSPPPSEVYKGEKIGVHRTSDLTGDDSTTSLVATPKIQGLPDTTFEISDFSVTLAPIDQGVVTRISQAATPLVTPQGEIIDGNLPDTSSSLVDDDDPIQDLEDASRTIGADNSDIGIESDVESDIELQFTQTTPLQAGETYKIEDMGVNTNINVPPQRMLTDAIAKAKQVAGFENATVKIKSSLDGKLKEAERNNVIPNYKVERYVNDHGVGLFKVSVDYVVELKTETDPPEKMHLKLTREFFSNANNENEALLAVYHVSRSIQKGAIDGKTETETTSFNLTYARDPESHKVVGVERVMAGEVDVTQSLKKKYTREMGEDGTIALKRAKQEKAEVSKESRLLNANVSVANLTSIEVIKMKGGVNAYIKIQQNEMNSFEVRINSLQKEIEQHELVQGMIAQDKKKFETLLEELKKGEADLSGLELPVVVINYLSSKQALIQLKDKGLDTSEAEIYYNQQRNLFFEEFKALFRQLDSFQNIQRKLQSKQIELQQVKVNLRNQPDVDESIIAKQEQQMDALLHKVDQEIKTNNQLLFVQNN